jgi:hypothetical protein
LPVERLVPAQAKCPYYAGFNWAEPSYFDLKRLMRDVYENPAAARAKGALAARDVRTNWSWDAAAAKIIARIDDIAQNSKDTLAGRPAFSKSYLGRWFRTGGGCRPSGC